MDEIVAVTYFRDWIYVFTKRGEVFKMIVDINGDVTISPIASINIR